MHFYMYHFMIQRGQYNVILRDICQQFMVDVNAKIESERLRYLRNNQKNLCRRHSLAKRYYKQRRHEVGNSIVLP